MTRRIVLCATLVVALVSAAVAVAAPSGSGAAVRQAKLEALSEKLKQRALDDKKLAQAIARQLGIPMRRELPNGKVMELQRFKPGTGPVFYITNNLDAADSVSTDEVWFGGSAGLALDGGGMTVGEWDGGAVLAEHPDLYPRVTQVDGVTAISNHSTHVAGTLIAADIEPLRRAKGMAPAADLRAYDWNSDSAEMAAAAASGLLLSNHSYGIAAGWVYTGGAGADEWWWIGGDGGEDANFGYYDSISQDWDQIAYDAPEYLIVKAAGNDRWDTGPSAGAFYTVVDQDGKSLGTSNASRPMDCAPAGYDCLPTNSVAKNILTVGAVDDVPGGYLPLAGPAGVQMTAFSGWGPTDDGRIKPDVVGNGWLLMSTYGQDPYYAAAIGTSMAAPNVTGSLLLLQQHHENLHGAGNFMRAATLKALAIHTADETGDADGPDYEYGWGLLNTKTAAHVISQDYANTGDHRIIESSLTQGATNTVNITLSDPDARVTATLVWNDPPGTPPAPALDPTDLMLVNDLDLRVSAGGVATYFPWVLNPGSPAAAAGKGDNFRDNVEQVQVSAGGSGSYAIQVSHKGALADGPQDYSLLISILPPVPISAGLLIDEDFSGGLPSGWSIVTPQGRPWAIRARQPGDARYDNNTGGSGDYAMVDNYINGDYDWTNTALRTNVLDLSNTTAAVLTFNSFFYYDFVETIYVEASTNGGASWTPVWQHSGFSNYPTVVTTDLSGTIAGHTNVMLQFRFQSGYVGPDGDHWKIDNVRLEVYGGAPPPPPPPELNPPGQAENPGPANGAIDVAIDTALFWSDGPQADSHDVYFGTSGSLGGADFQGNRGVPSFDPGTLAYDTLYYWRIDEVNSDGTTQGVTWSFRTQAAPAGDPVTLYVADLDSERVEGARNRWDARVWAEVRDGGGAVLQNATVNGTWSNGTSGSGSCLTASNGRCEISKNSLKGGVSSVSFTVTSVTHAGGHTYDAAANTDPDGDSTGSSIDVPATGGSANSPPTVTLLGPGNGSNFSLGESIAFSGSASDNEDGNLSGALQWTSDRDGAIGSGSSFSSSLSEGSHLVTASVSDSGGENDSATVTISVSSSPPPTTGEDAHVASLSGSASTGSRNRWDARVDIVIHSATEAPVAGALVEGAWSGAVNGSASCVTNNSGQCSVTRNNLKANASSLSFTVTNVSGEGITYDAGSNHQQATTTVLRP